MSDWSSSRLQTQLRALQTRFEHAIQAAVLLILPKAVGIIPNQRKSSQLCCATLQVVHQFACVRRKTYVGRKTTKIITPDVRKIARSGWLK